MRRTTRPSRQHPAGDCRRCGPPSTARCARRRPMHALDQGPDAVQELDVARAERICRGGSMRTERACPWGHRDSASSEQRTGPAMPSAFAFIWFAAAVLSAIQLVREWRQRRLTTSRTIQYVLLAIGAAAAGYLLLR